MPDFTKSHYDKKGWHTEEGCRIHNCPPKDKGHRNLESVLTFVSPAFGVHGSGLWDKKKGSDDQNLN